MRKKTPAPSKRPPKAKDFDPYWGVCPTCKRNDGFYLDIGRSNWFYCAAHQVRWCIWPVFGDWLRLLGLVHRNPLGQAACREWGVTSQQEVKRAAKAIDIRSDIDCVRVGTLLGCHVVDGSHHLAGKC